MKLSYGLALIVGALGAGGFVVMGCGGSSNNNSGDGGTSSGGGANDTCDALPASQCAAAQPPAVPSAPAATSMTPHNYAVQKLYLGDTDRTGSSTGTPWKAFGYNLDGKVTSSSSTDVCKLVSGAEKTVQDDGNDGIDNSFGENLIPTLLELDSNAGPYVNQQLAAGKFTLMTYVNGFDNSSGSMTSATGLSGVLLAGGDYTRVAMGRDGGAPGFNLMTHWPIVPTLLTCGEDGGACPSGTNPITSAVVQFPKAFQTDGLFVSGTPAAVTLNLSISGHTLSLDIESAVITFSPTSGGITDGTIAGVLSTQGLLNALSSVIATIDPSLCGSSAATSILQGIAQDSDILINGGVVSNVAGQTCNAISVGLGFDASEIALPVSADIEPPIVSDAGSGCDGG